VPQQSHLSQQSRVRARFGLVVALGALTAVAGCGQISGSTSSSTAAEASASSPADPSSDASSSNSVVVTVPGLGGASSSPAASSGAPASSAPASSTASSSRIALPNTSRSAAPSTPAGEDGQAPGQDSTVTETVTETATATETSSDTPTPTSTPKTTAKTTPKAATGSLAGMVVAIDPGHNGGNESHPEIINQKIDGGNGFTNVCNTTGTETNDGYAEHAFTWGVANVLKSELEAQGVKVVMTRQDDNSVGPCTPKRDDIENSSNADAVISIHADGADSSDRGFYVITNGDQTKYSAPYAAQSLALAKNIRDGLVTAGFPTSNWLGENGLWTRDDLTGLNFSTRPKMLVECGNMKNPKEAAAMSSPEGQKQYAHGLYLGVVAYLQSQG
jgi:N-acetylmuramoyl-L-alanine amidase